MRFSGRVQTPDGDGWGTQRVSNDGENRPANHPRDGKGGGLIDARGQMAGRRKGEKPSLSALSADDRHPTRQHTRQAIDVLRDGERHGTASPLQRFEDVDRSLNWRASDAADPGAPGPPWSTATQGAEPL